MRCEDAQLAVSTHADGERIDEPTPAALDGHLDTCASCRDFATAVRTLRSTLRLEPVDWAPDVATAVIARLRAGDRVEPQQRRADDDRPARHGDHPSRRTGAEPTTATGRRLSRRRTAVAAAAVAAGLVGGATFVGLGDTTRSPAAADVPERVLAAQHDINTLETTLAITEAAPGDRGPQRTFDAHLRYRAPETVALTVDETTPAVDPGDRAVGELVVDGDRWWQSTTRRCSPAAARVRCPADQVTWSRAVTGRPPFSDVTPVPLDLVSPVDSFALAAAPREAGNRTIAGRRAVGVTATVAQVDPLLDGLSAAVTLAPVHPTDPVELWLDADSLVPLALTVWAGTDADRAGWAAATAAADRPGDVVLHVEATKVAINESVPAPDLPGAASTGGDGQAADVERAASTVDAGFRAAPDDDPVLAAVPVPGDLPSGLRAHRSGVGASRGGPAVGVRAWSDGRAGLPVRAPSAWPGGRLFGGLDSGVVGADLGTAGHAYVSGDGSTVALHTAGLDVVVGGSLPPADLRDVAASLGLVGKPVPTGWAESTTSSLDEAAARLPGLLTARATDGFAREPAVRVDGDMVTEVRAGPGARSFTLSQRAADVLPPPTSGDETDVAVRGTTGRYSTERGELEWIEKGRALSLRSATLGFAELVTVADDLVVHR
jgi:hypothetical protein